jgi:hypothetical protein
MLWGQDLVLNVTARGSFEARAILVPPWDSPAKQIYDGRDCSEERQVECVFGMLTKST